VANNRITVTREDFHHAVSSGLITQTQADALWQQWLLTQTAQTTQASRFSVTHILYYLGGMIAIGAMTLFMTLGWESFGPWGVLAIAVSYGVACVAVARSLARKHLAIPAGILATLAIVLVPLAIWALQTALGLFPPDGTGDHYRNFHVFIDWRWMTLEFGTLIAAVIALWFLRYPFMVMPIAVTLWYMSMDLARIIVNTDTSGYSEWQYYRDFSVVFGLGMLAVAVWVDVRARKSYAEGRDFAFWLYLFGTLTFWCGLSLRDSDSELAKLGYCAINLGMIVFGAILSRRVFAVFGGLGLAAYLGHLSWKVFNDSMFFPFALTLIGLAIIGVGIVWQKNEARIGASLRATLPTTLREVLEARHDSLR